jgi:hypothetical protein
MASKCCWCGSIVSVDPGDLAPLHQERGQRNTCPGANQATNPIKKK